MREILEKKEGFGLNFEEVTPTLRTNAIYKVG
jgi:hypothetical protein